MIIAPRSYGCTRSGRVDENRVVAFRDALRCGRELLDFGAHPVVRVRLEHERPHDDEPLEVRDVTARAVQQVVVDALVVLDRVEPCLPQRAVVVAPCVVHADHHGDVVGVHADHVAVPAFGEVDDVVAVDALVDRAQRAVRIDRSEQVVQGVDVAVAVAPAAGDGGAVAVGVGDGVTREDNAGVFGENQHDVW